MKVHMLRDCPPPALARALADFDKRFTYPLGAGRWFGISHGADYPRFFRAMGESRCFVAEKQGNVRGAVAVAIRTLRSPGGDERQAAYIGDLKVDPTLRGSLDFIRLAQAADAWARPRVTAAYGVVMDGTRVSPEAYTGRIGIPAFCSLGKIIVLRISTGETDEIRCTTATPAQGEECYRALTCGYYSSTGGNVTARSEIEPFWLVHPEGLACGRLEDTRRAKRLIDSDGVEMRSAHLACFASARPRAGAQVIQAARWHAARLGLPALFVAVAAEDFEALQSELATINKVIAPATIYGAGLTDRGKWSVNSSEI